MKEVVLDCDAGRALGCATLCCRLIVRYADGEAPRNEQGQLKSCVDKDPASGLCVHLDTALHRCAIWVERPRVCREYDCNQDPRLLIVLRDGFTSLTRLVLADTTDLPRSGPEVPRKR